MTNGAPREYQLAPRRGRNVALRPVVPADYGLLQAAQSDPLLLQQWRFRGTTPSPEQWTSALWGGILAQFIVTSLPTNEPIGLVILYRHNFQDGHAYLGAMTLDAESKNPLMMLGLCVFVEYVFWTWPFRKLFFELPEYNLRQFESAMKVLLKQEGRLEEYTFFGGRYWDEYLLSITRDRWDRKGPRLLAVEGLGNWRAAPESAENS